MAAAPWRAAPGRLMAGRSSDRVRLEAGVARAFSRTLGLSLLADRAGEDRVCEELQGMANRLYKLQALLAAGNTRALPRTGRAEDEALEDLYRRSVELD